MISRIAFLRQPTSVPALKNRLIKSYRCAIWSNILATCSFLQLADSLNGTIVSWSCAMEGCDERIDDRWRMADWTFGFRDVFRFGLPRTLPYGTPMYLCVCKLSCQRGWF